ncbi:hypothetical protein K7432_004613 [Basidiobolus ranarum]|uniref:Uncharacterized protein n=1 Tax=Basidiobolus ranarum TaxID=34480 RepID=A0ABR2W4C6_9FUNG
MKTFITAMEPIRRALSFDKSRERPNKPLYKDRFITIQRDHISVHKYYPYGTSRKVWIKDISSLNTLDHLSNSTSYQIYGICLKPIWWALDVSRIKGRSSKELLVLGVYDHWMHVGASVERPSEAIPLLRGLIDNTNARRISASRYD